MFRKLKQGLGKGSKAKYRLDVAVSHVEGLPPGVAACRLQWARGGKVAVTKLAPATAGGCSIDPSCGDQLQRPACAVLAAPLPCERWYVTLRARLPAAAAGAVEWREELSQIATLIKLPSGSFEPKEYEFKLQVGATEMLAAAVSSSSCSTKRIA